ncbi:MULTISPECIES: PAS domain S-box protein [Flavobacterium]|uniref:PAS domain-containing sensor histidine kinase n=1 Tax=Flavobacterium TaxID=237 RepID=UPI0021144860|nr:MULTISPECIES: PAS domain S-box protein [Flavobacterium]UUF12422.1 PAS domain S-box protein [Flavobacterium panici]
MNNKNKPAGMVPSHRDKFPNDAIYASMVGQILDYGIVFLGLDGTVLSWNAGAKAVKGYEPDEIIGKNFSIFYFHMDRGAGFPEQMLETAERSFRAHYEGYLIKKGGGNFWASVTLSAVQDQNGVVTGYTMVTFDLTEKRMAEEKLRRNALSLERKNDELIRSEDLYHRMISEVEDYAILLLDIDGNIKNWNLGAEKIKGYRSQEIIGKHFSIFYQSDDIGSRLPWKLLEKAALRGKATHEGWRVKKDGSTFWGLIVLTALHDQAGGVIGFSKVTRDLTQRREFDEMRERQTLELRQANEHLRESEERYYKMIAEVEDYAIILLGTDGTIRNWNKGAEKIKGYTEAEAVGLNFRVFYTDQDQVSNLPELLLRQAAQNNKAALEGWRVRKDRTLFWGSIIITALHDKDNKLIGFSKVTRDLTHKKEYEEQILQQNRQLEEFAYIASHDLQEPLRKIQLYSSILSENLGDQNLVKTHNEKIRAAAARLSSLITSILDYSKLTAQQEDYHPTDLNEVLRNAMEDLDLLAAEKHAKFSIAELPTIEAVPIQIQQLFFNLISNALKFNKRAPEIVISCQPQSSPDDNMARICISDNGIGFSDEFSKKMFTMFQRVNKNVPGTGIGLALCKRIVENHRGTISFQSTMGKGTTFRIDLPRVFALEKGR